MTGWPEPPDAAEQAWSARYRCDLSGRTVVVTGASNGVGRELARLLAGRGAHVVLAVRDVARGGALAEILSATTAGSAEARRLDLADLASVAAFAREWGERPIDVLVNNAGMVPTTRRETADGFELALGTNFLGPFALTARLLPRIGHRAVVVASGAHRQGRVDLADPHWRRRRFSPVGAYAQSKLADLLWAHELGRRLRAVGSPVEVVSAHPGWSLTNLQNATASARVNRAVTAICARFAQSSAMGALPSMVAATADVPPDSYLGPEGVRELRGYPRLVGRAPRALDGAVAAALWEWAERETGVPSLAPAGRDH